MLERLETIEGWNNTGKHIPGELNTLAGPVLVSPFDLV